MHRHSLPTTQHAAQSVIKIIVKSLITLFTLKQKVVHSNIVYLYVYQDTIQRQFFYNHVPCSSGQADVDVCLVGDAPARVQGCFTTPRVIDTGGSISIRGHECLVQRLGQSKR